MAAGSGQFLCLRTEVHPFAAHFQALGREVILIVRNWAGPTGRMSGCGESGRDSGHGETAAFDPDRTLAVLCGCKRLILPADGPLLIRYPTRRKIVHGLAIQCEGATSSPFSAARRQPGRWRLGRSSRPDRYHASRFSAPNPHRRTGTSSTHSARECASTVISTAKTSRWWSGGGTAAGNAFRSSLPSCSG